MYKAYLIHLSRNMWSDLPEGRFQPSPLEGYIDLLPWTWQERRPLEKFNRFHTELGCDDAVFRRTVEYLAANGGNLLVIDVGDGIKFASHPEVSIPGAWSREKVREVIDFCRSLGIKVVPKLNFSAAHDVWLKEYARMVSSRIYYQVCADLIRETAEVFDGPELFHLGMDEETSSHQSEYELAVVRRGELWWHDLEFFCDRVRESGARPWMWSDKIWNISDDEFTQHVPRDVVQSNWYYNHFTDPTPKATDSNWNALLKRGLEAFRRLDRLGYDQIPCGSNWAYKPNLKLVADFCRKNCDHSRLLGFMMAVWTETDPEAEFLLQEGCELLGAI